MAAQNAFGTVLSMWNAAITTPAFVPIADVMDISGPKISRATIGVTSHDAPGGWNQYLPSLKDGGEVTFDVLYDPTDPTHSNSQGGLLYELTTATAANQFQITFPNGTSVWSFDATVTGFDMTAPVGDKLGAAVTLKITGAPTLV